MTDWREPRKTCHSSRFNRIYLLIKLHSHTVLSTWKSYGRNKTEFFPARSLHQVKKHSTACSVAVTNFSKQFLHSKAESDAVRLQQPSESRVTSPTAVNSCSHYNFPFYEQFPSCNSSCATVFCALWATIGPQQDTNKKKVLRVDPVPELVLSSCCLTIRVRVQPVQELV